MEGIASKDVTSPNFGYIVVGVSSCLFTFNNLLLLTELAPTSARNTREQFWKWRNTANSLIHSIISGVWALLNFWGTPEVRHNLMSIYTTSIQTLIGFSIGYFFYDLADMVVNHRKRGTYELALHHVVVIICFGLALVTRFYHGYTLLALMVEINSVFLHIRQLFIIQGFDKDGLLYRVNSLANIGTFVLFRLIPLGWMTRWLMLHRNEIPSSHFTLGCFANTIIFVMNAILLLRVLSKDCRHSKIVQDKKTN